jgi:hypothetical protein
VCVYARARVPVRIYVSCVNFLYVYVCVCLVNASVCVCLRVFNQRRNVDGENEKRLVLRQNGTERLATNACARAERVDLLARAT